MAEGSSGGFASFLKNSVGKLSSKKGDVKFLPPKTQNGKDEDEAGPKTLSQKEHRRAQVRKAQIEHRQRKGNYIKHLEQDVIHLRGMIATTEAEATAIKQENNTIKTALSKTNILNTITPSTSFQPHQQDISPSSFTTFETPPKITSPPNVNNFQSPQYGSTWPFDSLPTNVNITFDDMIDDSCLHVSEPGDLNTTATATLNSPDIFKFPANSLPEMSSTITANISNSNGELQKALPQLPGHLTTPLPADIDSIAINFILALEHPCRKHFHSHTRVLDLTGKPTGHELMASSLLCSYASPSTFPNPNSGSWTAPSFGLTQLYAMSQSLPKGDFEITPVQAWFLLAETFDLAKVLEKLDELKKGVSVLVGCWEFGAVMEVEMFWEVVGRIMGGDGLALGG